MGILTRINDYLRGNDLGRIETRSGIGASVTPWATNRPSWAPQTIDRFDHAGYRKVGLIFRCIQYLADAAGSAPLRAYDPDGEDDEGHPIRQLLLRPNPGMGESRFTAFVTMNLAICGFVVIEKVRNGAGLPVELWPLRSDWCRPILRGDGTVDWEYRVPGYQTPTILPADDVIAMSYADTPDLNMNPRGIGPLEVVLREAQISSALTDFLKAFLDRGALPLYAIIPQDEGPAAAQWKKQETKDAFTAAWKQRYQGLHNATEPLPMVGVKDIKRVGLDFNELAYPELNNLTDARICQAFGIPPILVGAQVGLEHATYANYGEARTSFYEDTVSPLWTRLDDAFTRQLLPEFEWRPGWDIHFDTGKVPALQDNQNELWERSTAALAAGGISTHTYHRLLGIDPHGADVFLRALNLIEVPNSTPTKRAQAITRRLHTYALPSHDPTAPMYEYREGRRYVNETRLSPEEREQRARVVAHQQATIGRLAGIIAPRLELYFSEQKGRVLDAFGLRSGEGAPEVRFAEAIDWLAEDDALMRIFAAWWEEAAESARSNAADLLGIDIDWAVSNPYIADVQGVLGDRIAGINLNTRIEIEDRLTALMGQGTTVPEMGKSIEDLFDQTYANRHLTVARTESMVAYADASTRAYEASGVVQRVQIADNPSHTETYKGAADGLTCASRNGLVVPLDRGNFHIQSDHPNGSACLIPVVTPLGEV